MDERHASLLRAWPVSWRHADTWRALHQLDTDDSFWPRAAARALVHGTKPAQTVERLIEDCDFECALALLDGSGGQNTPELSEEREPLERRLRIAQAQEQERRQECVSLISLRAARVGLVMDEMLQLEVMTAGRTIEADGALRALEAPVARAEDCHVDRLRSQLPERAEASSETEAWRADVERALQARDLEVAEWLLDCGPSPHHEMPLRRAPAWPYSMPLLDALDLLTKRRARLPGMDRWRPSEDDNAAQEFLIALDRLAQRAPPPEYAVAFTRALARFVGAEVMSTQMLPGGCLARLRVPPLPLAPALAEAAIPGGLAFWVPVEKSASPPVASDELAAVYTSDETFERRPGRLRLSARDLLPLLCQREGRDGAFLCALGRDVPLERALPIEEPDAGVTLTAAQVRAGVRQILIGLDVEVADIGVLDRLAYLSSGHPGLLRTLLRATLAAVGPQSGRPRARLRVADVEHAWATAAFRSAARALLFDAARLGRNERAVLAALVLVGSPTKMHRRTDRADLVSAMELLAEDDDFPSGCDLNALLERLRDLGLIDLGPDGSVSSARGGIGRLVLEEDWV